MSLIKTHSTGFYNHNSNSDKEFGQAEELAQTINDQSLSSLDNPDSELYRALLQTLNGGNMQQLSELQELCTSLAILLGSIDPESCKNSIDLPKAQVMLLRLKEMFAVLEESTQERMILFYQALKLHPDCADVRSIALQYYRLLTGDTDYGTAHTPIKTIMSKIRQYGIIGPCY